MGKLLERLKDPSRSGAYRVSGDAEVQEVLGDGLKRISLRGVTTKSALLERMAQSLGFPQWFGGNWDALEDCLTEREGYLLFSDYEAVPADDLGVLLDVLASVGEFWADQGRPFFAVFLDPRRALDLDDLFREA